VLTPDCTAECVHPHPNPAVAITDHAVLAYRADPTPENYERLLAAQRGHAESFMRTQTIEFIHRTKVDR
jgi:hypothetical protein